MRSPCIVDRTSSSHLVILQSSYVLLFSSDLLNSYRMRDDVNLLVTLQELEAMHKRQAMLPVASHYKECREVGT